MASVDESLPGDDEDLVPVDPHEEAIDEVWRGKAGFKGRTETHVPRVGVRKAEPLC